jgi:hypothetical protein
MKRNIIILLIAACVGVTWFSVNYKERLSSETKIAVENAILQMPEFPARPVWWQDDAVLAIGVVPDKVNPHHSAAAACKVLRANGISTTLVEIYDVVKIQQEDDWEKLAADNCRSF